MAKYVLKCAILGGQNAPKKGELIELTDEQAAHPFYASRITATHEVSAVEEAPAPAVVEPAAKQIVKAPGKN